MKLRDYQRQALDALAEHRREHPGETRLAIQMATGLGKTITFAHEAVEFLEQDILKRSLACRSVLILVHTDELAQQAEAKVRLVAGERWSVGVIKAERNDVNADIIIGSVQTLANPARRAQLHDARGVGLIIVDECHHAVANTYVEILKHFGGLDCEACKPVGRNEWCEDCRGQLTPVTGYTATLERGDRAALGHVWQDVVFTRDISWAVRKGYLVPPAGYTVTVPQMAVQTGTLHPAALDQALVDSIAPEAVVDAWLEQQSRDIARRVPSRSTVLFAPLVRSADAFRDAFRDAGVTAETVHGAMPREDRKLILKRYEAGDVQVVCNAMVLTEGWDVPRTKCVIWARPTTSRPLWIQGIGRGLRPWLDGPLPRSEQDCVLLVLSDGTPGLTSIADLSTRPIEAADGKSLLALEDEYDLSKDLEPDAPNAYAGRVDVMAFDPLVARSEKVWTRTKGGALFVPCGTRQSERYIAILPDREGYAVAWVNAAGGGYRAHRNVPDLELAMSLAEDEATERGGDFGRLIADKTRPWRKGVPSIEAQSMAQSMGLHAELAEIMASKRSGKAGRLADLINRERGSRLIDPVVYKLTTSAIVEA